MHFPAQGFLMFVEHADWTVVTSYCYFSVVFHLPYYQDITQHVFELKHSKE